MSELTPPLTGRWRASVLGFVAFATSFGAHVVAVNLPVYAQQVKFGMTMIGVLIASYDFAELAAKPVCGFIADCAGMKRTLLFGIEIFSIASLLYFPLVRACSYSCAFSKSSERQVCRSSPPH